MAVKINNIILSIDDDISEVKIKAAKRLNISSKDFKSFKILRESIDARKKNSIKFNYSVLVECDNESKVVSCANDKDIKTEEMNCSENFDFGSEKLEHRPVIAGMGPAGMFAGLLLAEKGYRPIIIERGEDADKRTESVKRFWNGGELDTESNVQFGEGGAGTFSDGKLTTRIKDPRCSFVIQKFVDFGAPEEIMYSGKPHIGTDILKNVVKNIRNRIIELGGEVKFKSKMENIISRNSKVEALIVNGQQIPCEALILAIGHSSRDTYEMLYKNDIAMTVKPFAVGVRIEHSQKMIDENQYGKFAGHPKLKAADYRLTYTSKISGRAVYSFCMCPGGKVVAAASENGRLVTNGMSYYKRDMENANSAIVVSVGENDFCGETPLKGMQFQRKYEEMAYDLGGGGYIAPVQLAGDFLSDKVSTKTGSIIPSYKPGYEFRDLRQCLPPCIVSSLKEGILNFNSKIKGFASYDAVLTGIETRTSSPIRIERDNTMQCLSLRGLYPAGEGAGYAGGIISAAVDGLKAAESIMKKWKSFY